MIVKPSLHKSFLLVITTVVLFGSAAVNAATISGYTVAGFGEIDQVGIRSTDGDSVLGDGAIEYYIPLGDASGTYGVGGFGTFSDTGNGGGTLAMWLRFAPVTASAGATLNILFEDLDLMGANDPTGFFETVNVFDKDGTSLTGNITNISNPLVAGDADTQQLLQLLLPTLVDSALYVRLDFTANYTGWGQNTPEYLTAEVMQVVPIPAAIWLFGSVLGLIGLGGRLKRQVSTTK